MTATPIPGRDAADVARFVERLASVMTEAGIPRMPSRVFAALLATDSGRLTAADLAAALKSSPAAISGAVRYLTQLGLVAREREPGSRRDIFVVHDDAWYETSVRQDQLLVRWQESLRHGVDILGADTPAGTRVAESLAFLEFLHEERRKIMERWRLRLAELRDARSS